MSGDLAPLAPAGAGALVVPDARPALAAALASKAGYLLDQGYTDAAALALTPELRAALPVAAAAVAARLDPTSPQVVMERLTPLLALTAGAGMAGGARTEWLAAAADALKGIPLDLLDRGVPSARSIADHPSRIIPAILAEVKDLWRARLRERGAMRALVDLADRPVTAAPAERCTPAEAREILAGVRLHEAGDPSRPTIVRGGSDQPARAPTRAQYLAMGVNPAVLDAIAAEAGAPAAQAA